MRKIRSGETSMDVLYFGVGGEKNVHMVLRFDFTSRKMSLRDSEKGNVSIYAFSSLKRTRPERSDLVLTVETKEGSMTCTCYNEFDFDAIERLCSKIIGLAKDLIDFSNELKPQLCFIQGRGWLKKNMKGDSEIRFILVERTAIIHPPYMEDQPQYLFPLWKRPCFTVGKNGVRFDLAKRKSVDVFFESEEVRDDYFNVMRIAAQKTPSDSVPLRKKLEMLVRLHSTPFEPHVPSHFAFAKRLWEATVARYHPGESMPDTTESERWKEMGVSTTSLSMDLRVCNMLGLVTMVYYAENYPADLDEIVKQQQQAGESDRYAVFPNLARICFMFFSLLNLGKKQTTWYPSFVTYPMWNYDSEAFELLVCIGLRLFNKKWESSSGQRNQTQCMNDLVADLSDTLARPPSPDGVPYVFSMFRVLLSRRQEGERDYFLPDPKEDEEAAKSFSTPRSEQAEGSGPVRDAWGFVQRGFLSAWMAAEDDRRSIMLATPFPTVLPEHKEMMARRAERKRLEIKWEAIKGVRNEFKQKFLCLICETRNRCVVALPCTCMAVCRPCYSEGMVCPSCKSYAVGFLEVDFADESMLTLR